MESASGDEDAAMFWQVPGLACGDASCGGVQGQCRSDLSETAGLAG